MAETTTPATATKKPSDIALIRQYFFAGQPLASVQGELKKLTVEEKAQLGDGIRDGSLTY